MKLLGVLYIYPVTYLRQTFGIDRVQIKMLTIRSYRTITMNKQDELEY